MAPISKIPASYWAGKWETSNIPVKFRGLLLQDYKHPHASGIQARSRAEKFVENFEEHYISPRRASAGVFPDNRDNIGRGMLLVGHNGTRKSTLAAAVLTEIQYQNPAGKVYYIRFSDWKKALTDTFEKEDTANKLKAKTILRNVEEAHLLVLDDIGQEYRTTSGFTESSLHEMLRVRYEAAQPTIATTNVSLSKMSDMYGESFDSFRYDAFDSLTIVSEDLRKNREKYD
jgi:DNA replication protein DnaC